MQSESTIPLLEPMLATLLRWLRYRLILSRRIDEKISLASPMLGTAECLRLLASVPDEGHGSCALPEGVFNAMQMAAQSCPEGKKPPALLLSALDACSTEIRRHHPLLANAIRSVLGECLGEKCHLPWPDHALLDRQEAEVSFSLSQLVWPTVPKNCGREHFSLRNVDASSFLQVLHDQLFGIEIAAAEVCALIPLRFPDLPSALDRVLARQSYEELRHAQLLYTVFQEEGGQLGAYPISLRIWNNSQKSKSLAEALFIQHFLGEGYALGHDVAAIAHYTEIGNLRMANIHRSLHQDELDHVKEGISWWRTLCGAEDDIVLTDEFEAEMASIPPQEPYFDIPMRLSVGFRPSEIERQERLAKRLAG